MTEQNTSLPQDAAQNTTDKAIPEHIANRFGVSGFRTEKFTNHEADLSKVNRCSDHPVMKKVLERIHNAAVKCQIK